MRCGSGEFPGRRRQIGSFDRLDQCLDDPCVGTDQVLAFDAEAIDHSQRNFRAGQYVNRGGGEPGGFGIGAPRVHSQRHRAVALLPSAGPEFARQRAGDLGPHFSDMRRSKSDQALGKTRHFVETARAGHLMRQTFLEHRDHMSEAARTAMDDEFSAASRETEEALIWMLAWLGDEERAEAIRILAELREIRP